MLLAEIGDSGTTQFTHINYDGNVKTQNQFAVVGGTESIETAMQNYLDNTTEPMSLTLADALQLALKTWAVGRRLSKDFEDLEENAEIQDEQINEIIQTELETGEIEAAVLDTTQPGDTKFRLLSTEEIQTAREI